MARKKKPVDSSPICDPAYLRGIDPIWMPGPVPPRFWEDGKHRRDYLLWLAHRLGFRTVEDFYRLKLTAACRGNYGRTLLSHWGSSAVDALQDCFPEYDWKPWLFAVVPEGFWGSPSNRRSYMAWLGERLGYRGTDDWYEVTIYDFLRNRGKGLISYYGHSPARAVVDLIPGRNWCEWKFHCVPQGFWEVAENRHRYLRWLGKELGFRRPEDWYQIQTRDFVRRHGTQLLARYSSLYDLMREFLPQLDWDRIDVHRPIQVEEVLAWADAHYARHGAWPTSLSGTISGESQTWLGINECLRSGYRGLPARTSLAKFLQKHRGVRIGRPPPHLSEKQILAWARAYFKTTGRWPSQGSGTVSQSPENTWRAVNEALVNGGRGLQGGSSLPNLLRRHGLK